MVSSDPEHITCFFKIIIKKLHFNVNFTFLILRSDSDTVNYNFIIIKPTRCTNFSNLFLECNSTCFGQFLCPSSGVNHCKHGNGICHIGLLTACKQDHDGTEFHPDPDAPIYQIYSWNATLHVSDSSSVHHQELITVHTAMVYVIQVC